MRFQRVFLIFKMEWHSLKLRYDELLFEGCLDGKIKSKLEKSISYRKMKINDLKLTKFLLETVGTNCSGISDNHSINVK